MNVDDGQGSRVTHNCQVVVFDNAFLQHAFSILPRPCPWENGKPERFLPDLQAETPFILFESSLHRQL